MTSVQDKATIVTVETDRAREATGFEFADAATTLNIAMQDDPVWDHIYEEKNKD